MRKGNAENNKRNKRKETNKTNNDNENRSYKQTQRYNPKLKPTLTKTDDGRFILTEEQLKGIYEDGVLEGEENINSLENY